jgi:hypothetical protein
MLKCKAGRGWNIRMANEPTLLAALAIGHQGVNPHTGRNAAQGSVHQFRPVGQAGFRPQFVSDALSCLKDGVEIIIRHKFGATKTQNIRMNAAPR